MAGRTNSNDPRYRTQRWRRLRHRALTRDGWRCTHPRCDADLRGRYAAVVDHIIEVIDDGSFWDIDNLQSLCPHHHRAKTATTAAARQSKERVSPNA